jgi:hypothetical protein
MEGCGLNSEHQVGLTGHYLNFLESILGRRTEELQRKAAEIEELLDRTSY